MATVNSFPLEEIVDVSNEEVKYLAELIPDINLCVYNAYLAHLGDPSGIRHRCEFVLSNGNKKYMNYKNKVLVISKSIPGFFEKKYGSSTKENLSEWLNLDFRSSSYYNNTTVKGNKIYFDASASYIVDPDFPKYYMKNLDDIIFYKYVGKVIKKKDLLACDSNFDTVKKICGISNFIKYVLDVFSIERYSSNIIKKVNLTKEDLDSIQKKVDSIKIA